MTCIRGKTPWPNKTCDECLPKELAYWEPKPEVVEAYVIKCLPGEANVSVTEETEYDNVDKPKHYMLFDEATITQRSFDNKGVEVRDVIAVLADKVYKSYETPDNMPMAISDYVQLMQYLMRFMDKNGKEDLQKARWYLDKLIENY